MELSKKPSIAPFGDAGPVSYTHLDVYKRQEKSYAWTIAQVKSILQDETYIGNSCLLYTSRCV